MTTPDPAAITAAIAQSLPYLRRYARALTGSQAAGDTYATATLEAVIADLGAFDRALAPKTALFKVFHSIWATSGGVIEAEESGVFEQAQKHLARLTTGTREALLLHTIEELPIADVAAVLDQSPEEVRSLLDIAYAEMARSMTGKVMIIEDESIIAMDLEAIVTEMGHVVTGIARTETEALDLFAKDTPDLILSDIQLADDSSGIDAVAKILDDAPDMPVIFITAFPERLLTGERKEPAFLIPKPYTEDQVRSAVSQAMFFSSTETLMA